MGQGIWLDSENLGPDDCISESLKHGTLTIGFIGLAETLKALIGKHHGESDDAQNLGLEIVGFMRKRTDEAAKKYGLNFSFIATPAEGLSGRFVSIDAKKYGVIEGVTDRPYYTNSFHIPVYYKLSAFDKIKREAPYHTLTNGGHISYVELDGDTQTNLQAFEDTIRCMKESGIGYGSINHPVDRDPSAATPASSAINAQSAAAPRTTARVTLNAPPHHRLPRRHRRQLERRCALNSATASSMAPIRHRAYLKITGR